MLFYKVSLWKIGDICTGEFSDNGAIKLGPELWQSVSYTRYKDFDHKVYTSRVLYL